MDIFILDLEGRCDGIITEGNDVIVEEIKSTYKPLYEIEEDYNVLHWLKQNYMDICYAKSVIWITYMYS